VYFTGLDIPVHHNCYVKIFYSQNHLLMCTKSFCVRKKIRNVRKTRMAKSGKLCAYSRICMEINTLIRNSTVKRWIQKQFQYQMFVLLHN